MYAVSCAICHHDGKTRNSNYVRVRPPKQAQVHELLRAIPMGTDHRRCVHVVDVRQNLPQPPRQQHAIQEVEKPVVLGREKPRVELGIPQQRLLQVRSRRELATLQASAEDLRRGIEIENRSARPACRRMVFESLSLSSLTHFVLSFYPRMLTPVSSTQKLHEMPRTTEWARTSLSHTIERHLRIYHAVHTLQTTNGGISVRRRRPRCDD